MKLGIVEEKLAGVDRTSWLCVAGQTRQTRWRRTQAAREVTKSCAVSNFVSADRIQVDRIGLRWNWIESRSNLVASTNAPLRWNAMLECDCAIHSATPETDLQVYPWTEPTSEPCIQLFAQRNPWFVHEFILCAPRYAQFMDCIRNPWIVARSTDQWFAQRNPYFASNIPYTRKFWRRLSLAKWPGMYGGPEYIHKCVFRNPVLSF